MTTISFTTVMMRLRRKLGDDAKKPKNILTMPRVGYRMAKDETREQVEPRQS